MFAFLVVELKVLVESFVAFYSSAGWFDVHMFPFDGSPQPFDEHVVYRSSFSVHGDLDVVLFEGLQDHLRLELRREFSAFSSHVHRVKAKLL